MCTWTNAELHNRPNLKMHKHIGQTSGEKKKENRPSSESKTYFSRIGLGLPLLGANETVRVERHRVAVRPRIVGEFPI